MKPSAKRYQKSPKGRATAKRYTTSEKGRRTRRARDQSPLGRSRGMVTKLVSRYKLSREQAQVALVSMRGDFCASCRIFAKLVVDHDHATGRARGMVCQRCNTIAGSLDSPLRPLVEKYLRG